MSEKKNNDVKDVVVKEEVVVASEAIDEKELKKQKVISVAKKVGKVLGIGAIGAALGYFIGSRSNDTDEEVLETTEYEVEESESNEDQE